MNQSVPPNQHILSLKITTHTVSLSRATIYRMMKKGEFPKSISLGGSRIGFIASEVAQWVDDKIAASRREAA